MIYYNTLTNTALHRAIIKLWIALEQLSRDIGGGYRWLSTEIQDFNRES